MDSQDYVNKLGNYWCCGIFPHVEQTHFPSDFGWRVRCTRCGISTSYRDTVDEACNDWVNDIERRKEGISSGAWEEICKEPLLKQWVLTWWNLVQRTMDKIRPGEPIEISCNHCATHKHQTFFIKYQTVPDEFKLGNTPLYEDIFISINVSEGEKCLYFDICNYHRGWCDTGFFGMDNPTQSLNEILKRFAGAYFNAMLGDITSYCEWDSGTLADWGKPDETDNTSNTE